MKVIKTQPGLFEWLGDQVKNAKPQVLVSKPIVDQFDEMIAAFGTSGWWHFGHSRDHFFQTFLDRVDHGASQIRCNEFVVKFVSAMASIARDVRHSDELRTHYLYALVELFKPLAKNTKVLLWEDGNVTRVQSRKAFERRHGVNIDVRLFAREGDPPVVRPDIGKAR
ncbi:hypothetical protein RFM41_13135 [Mesorhizobium sp. VK25A]|uniref:Uncharacterized protein n=1 Tax=Mesorhizobium vachelliae TaxID=3072309 RepID=A0ABU5A537_9HYPH|nr:MULTISPECIES: hypothetical protein [unclassified Mesorhizobium]MDX8532806.1 hypothetical protein [Mesorhizobium sp. VK25D]MDX8544688.1 hypothetical protein [Mesorhizobium sp. VK25A]